MRNKALLLATPAFLVHRLIEPYYSYLKGSSEVDMILYGLNEKSITYFG